MVLTKRCNLNCTYCHMNPEKISEDPRTFDMQPESVGLYEIVHRD